MSPKRHVGRYLAYRYYPAVGSSRPANLEITYFHFRCDFAIPVITNCSIAMLKGMAPLAEYHQPTPHQTNWESIKCWLLGLKSSFELRNCQRSRFTKVMSPVSTTNGFQIPPICYFLFHSRPPAEALVWLGSKLSPSASPSPCLPPNSCSILHWYL